ncbi:hypothetical protein CERSUDRAFT_99728 [Gelatoporia subvermispora B]|uniref:Uncharacterized protein n=1 Tax=Ceriporiopsis subvermispora (strain B) TaxID=914234 RepID=M2P9C4_CERS8|nr:hypothetical protein CERSUDRAFT_99728 [Gelatoporia subvermispora B]
MLARLHALMHGLTTMSSQDQYITYTPIIDAELKEHTIYLWCVIIKASDRAARGVLP